MYFRLEFSHLLLRESLFFQVLEFIFLVFCVAFFHLKIQIILLVHSEKCLLANTAALVHQIVPVSLNSSWLKTACISKTLKVQFNKNYSQGLEFISTSVKLWWGLVGVSRNSIFVSFLYFFPHKNFQDNQKLSFILFCLDSVARNKVTTWILLIIFCLIPRKTFIFSPSMFEN